MALSIEYDKSQFTPGKIALVIGLGGCFIYTLFGGNSKSELSLARPATDVVKARETVDRSVELKRRQQRTKAWERLSYDLVEMKKNDPFAMLGKRSAEPAEGALATNSNAADEETIAATAKAEEEKLQALQAAAEQRKIREERISNRIAVLQKQRVDAVFQSNGRTTALIGYKEINEGDLLDDGIRVIRITPKGLTLSIDESIFDDPSSTNPADGEKSNRESLEEAVRRLPQQRPQVPRG